MAQQVLPAFRVSTSASRGLRPLALGAAALLALAGCGSDDTKTVERERELQAYQSLKDLDTAPEGVRKAASAVVRIENSDGSSGTGFFAKVPSLGNRVVLVTNFHVVGGENCSLDGCYVELVSKSERGAKAVREKRWLKPAGASGNLDVAFYDVFTDSASAASGTNAVRPKEALALSASTKVSEVVYAVGHPFGGLKKVSEGKVYGTEPTWSESTNVSMPGNSGSPMLDASGAVVGVLFGGPAGQGRFSATRVLEYTYFARASDAAVKVDGAPETLAALYPDTRAEFALEDFAEKSAAFVAAEASPRIKGNESNKHVADLLGGACDENLAKLNLVDTRTTEQASSACGLALSFIQCGESASPVQKCVPEEEKETWRKRIEDYASRLGEARGIDAVAISSNVSRLESDDKAKWNKGLAAMERRLAIAPRQLDFDLAWRLLRYSSNPDYNYRGKSLKEYVTNYSKVTGYESSLVSIYASRRMLAIAEDMTMLQFADVASAIYKDPSLSLSQRLNLERWFQEDGILDRVERGY